MSVAFLRGVEAFLNAVPAASLEAMRMGMEGVGVTECHQIGILDQLVDSANDDGHELLNPGVARDIRAHECADVDELRSVSTTRDYLSMSNCAVTPPSNTETRTPRGRAPQ